jgi:hypothetical protein
MVTEDLYSASYRVGSNGGLRVNIRDHETTVPAI